ncbi:MAG: hypothetical protein N3B16_12080, partial [Candidatus Aminicenantes bacterium]|nr:hypothetical protein [Candidatus Aminicenantes bacterium]
ARPDVEQAYPTYPLAYRAGWGYMLLTNFLPNQGNGTYRLHAIAYDKEGNRGTLGTKTIHCNNAQATYPFGTIDTPTQGGQASGASYVNFAWVLTPQPKYIPTDGSTLLVWIDGKPQSGRPSYNHYRSDIATLFPGYANTNGAVGYYIIDTTKLTNGVHTIAWSVRDSAGVVAGIGSRYFTVLNTGSGSLSGLGQVDLGQVDLNQVNFGSRQKKIPKSFSEIDGIPLDSNPIYVRRGYDPEAPLEPIFADRDGWFRIEMRQTDRLEIMLSEEKKERLEAVRWLKGDSSEDSELQGATTYAGYLLVGDELRPLPIGSHFDSERGIFYWQPGPAFLHDYSFVFINYSLANRHEIKKIKLTIIPD